MAYINIYSLGPHCCPRMRLDYIKNKNNKPIGHSQFFDYLMCDIEATKKIFSTENIEEYLNINNIEIYHSNNLSTGIKLKNIRLDSIHDVPGFTSTINNYTELIQNLEMQNIINESFIKKYIRRHNRLIDLLKNNDNLCFIYQSNIEKKDYIELNNIFKKYTDKKIIIICFMNYGPDKEMIEKYENLYYLNIYNMYRTKDYIYDSSMEFLNWELIFENINKIYNENFNM